ncbi:hypothetical protein [Nonomuraea sp. NPDC046570]|uniref:hypothetical protein n=1 Tax=Nonomuraea sp. NPDC046570 TaxID=3155255 RepID=UPI0033E37B1E
MDQEPDLETLPDVEIPGRLPEEGDVAVTQLPVWETCLLFRGRPWQTIPISAESPEDAALIMDAFVAKINAILVQRRYPPGTCTWTANACP